MDRYTLKMFTHKDRSEVDIRVAQELKNNKDFIYQTNQSLQALNHCMASIRDEHANAVARFSSERAQLLITFENFSEDLTKQTKDLTQKVGDVETKLAKVLESISDIHAEMSMQYVTKDNFINTTYPQSKKIDKVESDLIARHDSLGIALATMQQRINVRIEDLKKELTPVTPQIDPIKKQIDERLEVFKVDFDGLIREISLIKKDVSYGQKKFENIYTLIERLKEGKS